MKETTLAPLLPVPAVMVEYQWETQVSVCEWEGGRVSGWQATLHLCT